MKKVYTKRSRSESKNKAIAIFEGKYYLTDVADTETILRLIQSIPSPNAVNHS